MNAAERKFVQECEHIKRIERLEDSLLKCAENNATLTTTINLFVSHQAEFNDELRETQKKLHDDIYGYMRETSEKFGNHETQLAVVKSTLNWLPVMIFFAVVAAQFMPQLPIWLENILKIVIK